MMSRKILKGLATTVAVTGMMLTAIADLALAATILNNDGTVNGVIRLNAPTYRFRNESRTGSPIQTAPGEEYVFTAEQGDTIEISVETTSATLSPVLVLISSATGRQVAYDDSSNSLQYQVPTSGQYRLLVLGQNNSRGRYTLSVSGIGGGVAQTPSTSTADRRRQLLQDEYGLRVLDSCPPATGSLAVISFPEGTQTYRYCANPNRLVRAGEYTYNAASGELTPGAPTAQGSSSGINDQRRQLLQNEYGLRVLDSCPPATGSLAVISFPEATQTYRYCANPNRLVRAGEYTYDAASGELRPGAPFAQGSSSTLGDRRRQLLRDDFGLQVLNSCPAATGSLVVVSFPETDQTYRYCANPNREYPAGEYTYNARINDLEAATTTGRTDRCTVEVGGVCIVR